MPRLLLSSISILAAALLVTRCGTATTGPSNNPGSCGTVSTTHGTISAQLDGAAWSGTVIAVLTASLHEVSITGSEAAVRSAPSRLR